MPDRIDDTNNGQQESLFVGRLRRTLRRASFIIPSTGERSRRVFTLREASHRSAYPYESEPLLGDDEFFSNQDHFAAQPPQWIDTVKRKSRRQALRMLHFLNSRTGKAIFKCSVAYALASTATLVPAVSNLFGHRQDSKHLVATVATYFHPARTIGSMHEATILAAIAVAYSAFISFTSMGLSMFFGARDLLALGHVVVLVVFVGGGLGLIALVKQRMGNPLVNVAASLAALGCITILIKEGSVQAGRFSHEKVVQILCMVIMGVVISTIVNLILFPVLARRRLSQDMEKTTGILGEMLVCITRAFLRGSEKEISDDFFKRLNAQHQEALNEMKGNLGEARMEFYVIGKERIYDLQAKIVACLVGLAQDLGGLRSAAHAQFSFIQQPSSLPASRPTPSKISTPPVSSSVQQLSQSLPLDMIHEAAEDEHDARDSSDNLSIRRGGGRNPISRLDHAESYSPDRSGSPFVRTEATTPDLVDTSGSTSSIQTPETMFLAFITQLGPPTKSLVFTLKQILDELPFKERPDAADRWNPWIHDSHQVAVNAQLHSSLSLAVEMYREARKEALKTLHQHRAMSTTTGTGKSHSSSRTAAISESRNASTSSWKSSFYTTSDEMLADIEEVSACCGHFSFSLLDFAEDVLKYLDILGELKTEVDADRYSWTWLLPWHQRWKRLNSHIELATVQPRDQDAGVSIPPQIRKADNFADTNRLPKPWYFPIYKALRIFRRDDVNFAMKVGIGAILYALPAFHPQSRPFFVHWRGEWGLVTYMLVCCMTIGASNTTGINRFIGTFIGSCLAVAAWVISNNHGVANPWLLGFFGWLVSLPCFYINIKLKNGPFCRFILLTYNLGALYSYSLSIHDDDNDDDEGGIDPAIWDIVLHRFVSVVVGIVWGLFISRVVWPVSARRKLTQGLSVLWLRMGLIFKRDPLVSLLLGTPSSTYMDIREESELHSFLNTLKTLRKAAVSEFELQGPFPDAIFGRILTRTSRMLDAFHALNVVISKNLQYTPGEAAVLRYTRAERVALSARISHLLTVLASSIRLEYPVNDDLPDIENSRDRLLARISEYRRTGSGRELTTEQDYELLYAYVLVTGQLARDIKAVVPEIENLYGTLNEDNLKLE